MRRFLRHLDPCFEMAGPPQVLAQQIGAEALAALVRERVLVPAGSASALPCLLGIADCQRIVAKNPGARVPYLALCGSAVTHCLAEPLSEEQVAQLALSRAAFLELLQRLLGIEGRWRELDDLPSAFAVGTRGGRPVVFCYAPREPELGRFRRRHPDPLLVVPSASHVYTSTGRIFEYKPAKAQILCLQDVLYLENGRVRAAGVSEPTENRGRLTVPAGTTWRQVEIYSLNDDVVGIRIADEAPVACSPGDLGMVRDSNRTSTVHWQLLLVLCAGRGECTRREAGVASAEVLRTRARRLGVALRRATGIDMPALEFSQRTGTVRALFRALPEAPRKERRLHVETGAASQGFGENEA